MSGAHAAIAAAEKRRKEREEERMMGYSNSDLEGYEFKIVRSVTSAFSKPDVFYRVLEEEALAGWDLLEKLDDGRIRFKRPTSARRKDSMLPEGINPYRTRIGITEAGLAFAIILVSLGAVGVIATVVEYIESGTLF
jgi:hypothetical protein